MPPADARQCCNAEIGGGGGWGIFNAILGWENSATYGSVISYNLYWLCVIIAFVAMRFNEKNGHWPLMKPKHQIEDGDFSIVADSNSELDTIKESSLKKSAARPELTHIREIHSSSDGSRSPV